MNVKRTKRAPGLRPYTEEDFKKRRYDVLMHYSLEQLANFLGSSSTGGSSGGPPRREGDGTSMEECSCCFWKDKGADICRSCHGEGKAPICGACIHKAVCVYRMNAEAIMAAIADIMKREEAKCGIFTVSIKCDHFIGEAGTAAK